MKKVILSSVAFVAIAALLVAIFFTIKSNQAVTEDLISANNADITKRLDELEVKVDTDTTIKIRECEIKAMQTVVNIFSPGDITKDSTLEYDFNIFTDEAYGSYVSEKKTFAGQQLITLSANNSSYDTREKKIYVFIAFIASGYEGRNQYNFVFTQKNDNWIIEGISNDA